METHRFLEFKECQCKSKQKQEALDNFVIFFIIKNYLFIFLKSLK